MAWSAYKIHHLSDQLKEEIAGVLGAEKELKSYIYIKQDHKYPPGIYSTTYIYLIQMFTLFKFVLCIYFWKLGFTFVLLLIHLPLHVWYELR